MISYFLLLLHVIGFINGESSKPYTVEHVAGPFTLSEGPHWDDTNKVLYFVDILAANIHCWDPAEKSITTAHLSATTIGVVIPIAGKNNTLIAGADRKLVEVTWNYKSNNLNAAYKTVANIDVNRDNTRVNDGKIDPRGRFWVGTMANEVNGVIAPDQGALYRVESDLKPVKILSPVSISNGLAWSPNNDTFYYIDSPTKEIVAYNYNVVTGDITNKRSLFSLTENNIPGVPDGMTIDAAGNLWIAVFDGQRVIEVDPKSGKLLRTIEMPVSKVTSAAFGGLNHDILYVTSGKQGLTDAELKQQPLAGSVFAVHGLGVIGSPMRSFKLN